jgi:acyl-CoA reductase-like NAD-dependent aldehyde dehydrogenase/nicotinamidase-related amidase
MNSVLVVVDVQNELVADQRLAPTAEFFLPRVAALLSEFRRLETPIVHVHYVTEPDGRGYMAHHEAKKRRRCVRGTPGAAPHPVAEPNDSEPVFAKHSYSAFSTPEFEAYIRRLGADTVVICGLYSHACVRQTALDALERRYQVRIAQDAIASYDALHAEVTRNFMADRGVEYMYSKALIDQLSAPPSQSPPAIESAQTYPVACIDGRWLSSTDQPVVELRNPSRWEQLLGYLPMAEAETVESAVLTAVRAQHEWKARPLEERIAAVEKWALALESRADQFLPHMIDEVGKPLDSCRGEMAFLRQSLQVMLKCFTDEPRERVYDDTEGRFSSARRCPHGVVAILAPWNNPIFLPASKIAAAVALGNGVVWKPALPCARTSIELQNSLLEAGLPPGLVNLVFGGASTARHLIALPGVMAVTLTGSIDTGRQVAATCGPLLKPLQAELGGNNAALVTGNCDLAKVADEIALNAFAYAGQGCTATRRLVIPASIEEEFLTLLKKATQALVIGNPHEEDTVVGPVISKAHQRYIQQFVAEAGDTARIFEADVPEELMRIGCWLPPRIVQGLDESALLVQEETFAPVLVVQTATDLQDAIRLCNGVPNGLVGSIYCNDEAVLHQFRDNLEAGVVRLNLPTRGIHLEAPFGGWKDSGLGPPEHGVWDLDFYSQWQAVYESR